MGRFLEKYNLLKLIQENRKYEQPTTKEMKSIINNCSTMKTPGTDGFSTHLRTK